MIHYYNYIQSMVSYKTLSTTVTNVFNDTTKITSDFCCIRISYILLVEIPIDGSSKHNV